MPQWSEPKSAKVCPVCQVTMHVTVNESDTVHRCERCGLIISVGYAKLRDYNRAAEFDAGSAS